METASFIVIGGPESAPAVRLKEKLDTLLNARAMNGGARPDVLLLPCAYATAASDGEAGMRMFDAVRRLPGDVPRLVLLADWCRQSCLRDLATEAGVQVAGLFEALRRRCPSGTRLGVLGGDDESTRQALTQHLQSDDLLLLYPSEASRLLPAAAWEATADAAAQLGQACRDLRDQGATLILLADATIARLAERWLPGQPDFVDPWQIYAEYALALPVTPHPAAFKIGVVGGLGPAATVDFLDKLVRNTPASGDQDHFKVVVEQNPQIPDRTAFLLGDGDDPTLALYAACKRVEADGASLIAIPCNTAHAYVSRLQPFLNIPVVNMLAVTADYIAERFPPATKVGLLATRGTVASRVYHDVILPRGFDLLVPDEKNQALVMNAIYGPQGVKAGFTSGACRDELLQALQSLVVRGAEVIILGCTELPLILVQDDAMPVGDRRVAVLDPTTLLARRCVQLGQQAG